MQKSFDIDYACVKICLTNLDLVSIDLSVKSFDLSPWETYSYLGSQRYRIPTVSIAQIHSTIESQAIFKMTSIPSIVNLPSYESLHEDLHEDLHNKQQYHDCCTSLLSLDVTPRELVLFSCPSIELNRNFARNIDFSDECSF